MNYWTFSKGLPFSQRLWLCVINWCDGRYYASRRWSGLWSSLTLRLCGLYRHRFGQDPIVTNG